MMHCAVRFAFASCFIHHDDISSCLAACHLCYFYYWFTATRADEEEVRANVHSFIGFHTLCLHETQQSRESSCCFTGRSGVLVIQTYVFVCCENTKRRNRKRFGLYVSSVWRQWGVRN